MEPDIFMLVWLAIVPVALLSNLYIARYHKPFVFEFYDPATRGYSPLQDTEEELLRDRARLQPNARPLWYRPNYYRIVLTNRRLCVSYYYAAKAHWLYTLPVSSITGAYVNFDRNGILDSFTLKLDTDCSTPLQTLLIRFATPAKVGRWTRTLEDLGIPVRGDIAP